MSDPTPAPAPSPAPAPAPSPAPSPAPAPTPAPAAGDWHAGIKDEATRNWVVAKGYPDVAQLAESARNLEKLTGDLNSIVRLPKDDTPEAWTAVYDKLGRPKEAKDYALPVPEGDKSGFHETAAKWFHEAGVNTRQAKAIAEKWNEFTAAAQKAHADEMAARDTAQVNELKQAWGAEFDKHAQMVDAAAQRFGMSTEQLTALKQAMGPGPAMRFMHNLAKSLGVESTFVDGDGKGFHGTTAEQAKAQIAALQKDKAFGERFNSKDPTVRGDARKEMAKLHQIAWGVA